LAALPQSPTWPSGICNDTIIPRLSLPGNELPISFAAATARSKTSLQGTRTTLGFLSAVARKTHGALLVIHR